VGELWRWCIGTKFYIDFLLEEILIQATLKSSNYNFNYFFKMNNAGITSAFPGYDMFYSFSDLDFAIIVLKRFTPKLTFLCTLFAWMEELAHFSHFSLHKLFTFLFSFSH